MKFFSENIHVAFSIFYLFIFSIHFFTHLLIPYVLMVIFASMYVGFFSLFIYILYISLLLLLFTYLFLSLFIITSPLFIISLRRRNSQPPGDSLAQSHGCYISSSTSSLHSPDED